MKQSSYVQNAGHPTRQLVKTPKINVKKIKRDRKTLLHLKKKKWLGILDWENSAIKLRN